MDTVRIARDFGTVHELLPDGITDLRDCPHVLFSAIKHALAVLSFEELPTEDRPPKRIWNDGEALSEFFDALKRKHNQGNNGPGPIEDPVDNDAARSLLVG